MSMVPANIDADFQITYVFNGIENVGSTETILSGTQGSQNVGFRMFSIEDIAVSILANLSAIAFKLVGISFCP